MSGAPTRKRARVEATNESDGSQGSGQPTSSATIDLVKDKEFWFQDGNITLIASGVEFRVYKGVLASHSSVFADMFSLPQPPASPDTNPSMSCDVVHLEDWATDVRHILRALLPSSQAS